MSKFHKNVRVLEIAVTAANGAQTMTPTAVNFRRDGLSGPTYPVGFTTVASGVNSDVILSEQIEGPMIVRIVGTITA